MSTNNHFQLNLPESFKFEFHPKFSEFMDRVIAELTSPSVVTLDFSQVRSIDTAALGMLVLLKRKISDFSGVQIHIKNTHGFAKDMLEMANMQSHFVMHV